MVVLTHGVLMLTRECHAIEPWPRVLHRAFREAVIPVLSKNFSGQIGDVARPTTAGTPGHGASLRGYGRACQQ